jgi:hypothetical protein
MHSWFEWWAQIIIPSAVGLLTLFVSGVALWVSHRASVLANAVEKEREAASAMRQAEAAEARIREMAVTEARTLYRWFREATRPVSGWPVSRLLSEPPLPGTPLGIAEAEVEAAFQHSLVPGAATLLAITNFDLDNRSARLPDIGDLVADGPAFMVRDRLLAARDTRTLDRIRRWAFAPEVESQSLCAELKAAEADQPSYLRAGQDLQWVFPADEKI